MACFPVIDGIPVLASDLGGDDDDELDHISRHGTREQAAYFDRAVAEEYEITRPRTSPRLHAWLLEQKFAASISRLASLLAGAFVLTVCGGSGMDSEFLSRAGARVICSDISLGAAKRCRERARRYGLPITPIVADIEHLPFADRSIDLVYVHDGLHHLVCPERGIREMARVASKAVSLTEPSKAYITRVAVRLRLALDREEAGNAVSRLAVADVIDALRRSGFQAVVAKRYAMFYRHRPGKGSRYLSQPVLFTMSKLAWRLCNYGGGRWGNKLTVQAVRSPNASTEVKEDRKAS